MISNVIKLKKYLREILKLGINQNDLYYMYELEQHNIVITETCKNTFVRKSINSIISSIYNDFFTIKNSQKEILLDIVYMPHEEIADFHLPLATVQINKLISSELHVFYKTKPHTYTTKKNDSDKTTSLEKSYDFSAKNIMLQPQDTNQYILPEQISVYAELADAA